MCNHLKYSLICFLCIIAFFFGRPASAQIHYSEITFKDSLVQMLFQYAREVYFRGVDPQEAAFVFQRVLILDCRHGGAQEFLEKIHNKYPDVSIRISGCSDQDKTTESLSSQPLDLQNEETPKPSSHRKSHTAPEKTITPITPGTELQVMNEKALDKVVNPRATPLRAFSEPTVEEKSAAHDSPEVAESTDSFPIIEPSSLEDVVKGQDQEMNVISRDCDKLRIANEQLEHDITQLKAQIQAKEEAIVRYQNEIISINGGNPDASYALIAQDQRDLIRIQQENIDYLGKELAEIKAQVFGSNFETDPAYSDMRRQIASAQLSAKENEMNLEVKNREAQLLQKQLGEQQEQLRLVKKILSEKNDIIKSLQDELQALRMESD